ncbi:MAG: hypothetical protein QG657_3050 [Acidobacteriota bacterium]|nr:hypothetical protein [Acidobacteriota bacterium]
MAAMKIATKARRHKETPRVYYKKILGVLYWRALVAMFSSSPGEACIMRN